MAHKKLLCGSQVSPGAPPPVAIKLYQVLYKNGTACLNEITVLLTEC